MPQRSEETEGTRENGIPFLACLPFFFRFNFPSTMFIRVLVKLLCTLHVREKEEKSSVSLLCQTTVTKILRLLQQTDIYSKSRCSATLRRAAQLAEKEKREINAYLNMFSLLFEKCRQPRETNLCFPRRSSSDKSNRQTSEKHVS